MVIDYRNELKERGYAPATIALHLSAISSFCRHALLLLAPDTIAKVVRARMHCPPRNDPAFGTHSKYEKVCPFAHIGIPYAY